LCSECDEYFCTECNVDDTGPAKLQVRARHVTIDLHESEGHVQGRPVPHNPAVSKKRSVPVAAGSDIDADDGGDEQPVKKLKPAQQVFADVTSDQVRSCCFSIHSDINKYLKCQ
jgi:hypothetical protein